MCYFTDFKNTSSQIGQRRPRVATGAEHLATGAGSPRPTIPATVLELLLAFSYLRQSPFKYPHAWVSLGRLLTGAVIKKTLTYSTATRGADPGYVSPSRKPSLGDFDFPHYNRNLMIQPNRLFVDLLRTLNETGFGCEASEASGQAGLTAGTFARSRRRCALGWQKRLFLGICLKSGSVR